MDFNGKKVLMIGMARSGIAATKLLCQKGAQVWINDTKTNEALGDVLATLQGSNIVNCLGAKPEQFVPQVDCLVISPGVPLTNAAEVQAKALGMPVLGEIEIAYQTSPQTCLVAITGTNGKTTTTALVGAIFAASGAKTHVVGNIGTPYTSAVLEGVELGDTVVAEISSYQLETVDAFHPKAAAVLNLTPDHLQRHFTMENYAVTKKRIFENMTQDDYAILNAEDAYAPLFAQGIAARVLYFHKTKAVEGAFVQNGNIVVYINGQTHTICPKANLGIPGAHNLENALAATLLAWCCGVPAQVIAQGLRTFAGVEHRLQYCGTINGVRFINDSKATNPDSTIKAVQAMDNPTVMILGGSKKDSDYLPMFLAFTEYIDYAVFVGETTQELLRDAAKAGFTRFVQAANFADAVNKAFALCKPGYNLLLSPACASFDAFTDFEERGRVFQSIAAQMGAIL